MANPQKPDELKILPPQEEQKVNNDGQQAVIESLKSEVESLKQAFKMLDTKTAQTPPAQAQTQANNVQNSALDIIKEAAARDIQKVEHLVSLGKINADQGAALKNSIILKAFGNIPPSQAVDPQPNSGSALADSFAEFEQAYPDFFASDARNAVKAYLQNAFEGVSKTDIETIADLVKTIESSAVKAFQDSKAREDAILQTNSDVKKRLASTVMSASKPQGVSGRPFSREEIGQMSPDEFRKNEPQIMAQLRAGLIK